MHFEEGTETSMRVGSLSRIEQRAKGLQDDLTLLGGRWLAVCCGLLLMGCGATGGGAGTPTVAASPTQSPSGSTTSQPVATPPVGSHHPSGTNITWNGKPVPIQWVCTEKNGLNCASRADYGVACATSDGIIINLKYPATIVINWTSVTWGRGIHSSTTVLGRAKNFDPNGGADLDVVFQLSDGDYHLAGHVSCS